MHKVCFCHIIIPFICLLSILKIYKPLCVVEVEDDYCKASEAELDKYHPKTMFAGNNLDEYQPKATRTFLAVNDLDEYHPKATRTMFVGNLHTDIHPDALYDVFKKFGEVLVNRFVTLNCRIICEIWLKIWSLGIMN